MRARGLLHLIRFKPNTAKGLDEFMQRRSFFDTHHRDLDAGVGNNHGIVARDLSDCVCALLQRVKRHLIRVCPARCEPRHQQQIGLHAFNYAFL